MEPIDDLVLAITHATGETAYWNDYHENHFVDKCFKGFVGKLPMKITGALK